MSKRIHMVVCRKNRNHTFTIHKDSEKSTEVLSYIYATEVL